MQRALLDLALDFPILLDSARLNWQTWANRYWPARYLVDKDGYVSYFHYGEGDYVGFEWNIQLLLRQRQPATVFPAPMLPLRPADEPGAVCYRCTPKLYLGYQREQIGNPAPVCANRTVRYVTLGEEKPDTPYLQGYWHNGPEAVSLAAGDGEIHVRYRAKEVAIVLTPPEEGAGRVEVLQDDAVLANEARGDDAQADGQAIVLSVERPRLYSVVNNPHHGQHTLRLRFCTHGI